MTPPRVLYRLKDQHSWTLQDLPSDPEAEYYAHGIEDKSGRAVLLTSDITRAILEMLPEVRMLTNSNIRRFEPDIKRESWRLALMSWCFFIFALLPLAWAAVIAGFIIIKLPIVTLIGLSLIPLIGSSVLAFVSGGLAMAASRRLRGFILRSTQSTAAVAFLYASQHEKGDPFANLRDGD